VPLGRSASAGPGSPDTVDGVHSIAAYLADKGPDHVPGVVLTGVVVGVLLMLAAIRGMFGKRK
jgi:hypothetical protein